MDAVRAVDVELDQFQSGLRQYHNVLRIPAIFDAIELLFARALVHADEPVRAELEDTAAEQHFAHAALGKRLELSEGIVGIGPGRSGTRPLAEQRITVRR